MIRIFVIIISALMNIRAVFSFETTPSKELTVSIYMASNNDLIPYAKKDLKEISNYFIKNDNRIKVNLVFEKPNKTFITTNRTRKRMELKLLDNPPDSIGERLKLLLEEKQEFLILWGHGEGYIGHTKEEVTGGVLFEGEAKNPLKITELKNILEQKMVRNLIFDACLMQSIEVISELMNVTETITGSAQTQDYFGLPYTEVFQKINQDYKSFSDTDFYEDMINIIAKGYPNNHFTISTINTHEFKYQFLPAFKNFLRHMTNFFEENLFYKFLLKQYLDEAPRYHGDKFDIGEFLSVIKKFFNEQNIKNPNLHKSLNMTRDAIKMATASTKYGEDLFEDYTREHFLGLSIWVPIYSQSYILRKVEMNKSALYKALAPYSPEIFFSF